MPNRARDWLRQSERDLEQARDSRSAGRHEWACFASHQAARKAVKAVHHRHGQDVWGHAVARLLEDLPEEVSIPPDLAEKAHVLDNFYVPARYPNGHNEGAPFEHFGALQSEEGIRYAGEIIQFARAQNIPNDRLAAGQAGPLGRPHSRSGGRARADSERGEGEDSLRARAAVSSWPDARTVDAAFCRWAGEAARARPDVARIGYFGSYARGNWGVGSDLDVVIVLERSQLPFERRSTEWDTSALPVPADVLVYTEDEWLELQQEPGFIRTAAREAVWAYVRG